MNSRVYLAGPDVFLPEPDRHAAALKAICRQYGLHGVSPLDALPDEPADWIALPEACRIARRNEAHIRSCHAVVANLTPFRGPGADVGTAYEVGFARALGLKVFGWTTSPAGHADRVRAMPGSSLRHDAAGLSIEDFGLHENLMVSCGIEESGGLTVTGEAAGCRTGLALFELCVRHAASSLGAGYSLTSMACELGSSIGLSGRSARNSA